MTDKKEKYEITSLEICLYDKNDIDLFLKTFPNINGRIKLRDNVNTNTSYETNIKDYKESMSKKGSPA